MPKTGQDTNTWLKGIQRLTGTPGNQSPGVRQILETPTPTDPHPEEEVPENTPVVERHVVRQGGQDAQESDKSTTKGNQKGGQKATNGNDTQRTRGNS